MNNNLISMYQNFMRNPMQAVQSRFNIPQGMSNPNDIINHLVSSGQVPQAKVNQIMAMRNNPLVQQLMMMK